jgi:DNA-binding Xre family transcriptional regulator
MSNRPGPFAQRIAAEIRAELGRQHLSKRWLAEQIGQPHVTVTRWVNGDGPLSLDWMDAICEALGVSVVDVLARAVESKTSPLPVPRPPRIRRSARAAGVPDDPANSQEASRDNHEFVPVAA